MDADLRSIAAARRAAERAWDACLAFRTAAPEAIDEIVMAMAQAIEPEAERLARLAVEETGHGNIPDKRIKNLFNSLHVAEWLRNVRTLGVLWRDEAAKVAAIGEPMGVVAALIPVTNPTSTVIFKALSAVKSGNAVVCAPHPRGVRCGVATVQVLARAAEQAGAPPALVQCLDEVTLQGTAELMRHRRTSVVMATGGPAMVRAAYSSGKPTLAVGAGNVPVYVHGSIADDIGEVAEQILTSKSFDYGTACVAEQAVIADRPVARALRHEMKLRGAYFCTAQETRRLAGVLFAPDGSILPGNVGQAAARLAALADFGVPPRTRVLVGGAGTDRAGGAALRGEAQSGAGLVRSLGHRGGGLRSQTESCGSADAGTPVSSTPATPKWSPRSAGFPPAASSSTPRRSPAGWASRPRSSPASCSAPARCPDRS